ncbi:hypothetical protein [Prescottella agglutinans]|uniref:DUF3291 domain-containing protein n=1 Tax=Prescottella agglutinans TaxID=1644129 RepID=A0ABT6MJZ6_9NOCA|nr:hypothetical protein [Prescottella agglutinans]MDH6284610.1 hypothetical protein [Prescottella agglutinans]
MTAPIRMTMHSGEFRRSAAWPVGQQVKDLAEAGWYASDNGFEWPPVNEAFVHVWTLDAWRLLTDPERVVEVTYNQMTGRDWATASAESKAQWRAAESIERARIARLPHWRTALAAPAAA